MDPRQHEMGERCTDDLGLVVVVGQACNIPLQPSVITRAPGAEGPGNEGMKRKRCGRNPRSAPAGMRRGSHLGR